MKRGQATLDYVFLLGVAAAGLVAMLIYIGRGFQGNIRSNAEQLGAWQYEPGATIHNSRTKTAESTAGSGSNTPVCYGNLNEPNTALEEKLKEIADKKKELDELRKAFELTTVSEARIGAVAVRGGFDYPVPSSVWTKAKEDMDQTYTELQQLYKEAEALAEAWRNRTITPDTTCETSSWSREEGSTTDHKHTDEVLGNLK